MKARYLAGVFVLIILGGCASAPSGGPVPAQEIIDVLNGTPVEEVIARLNLPMVFDAEIVTREADAELVVVGLREAGFQANPRGFTVEPVRPEDFRRVGDTFDMRVFFGPDGPLPGDAKWIETDSNFGRVLILFGGERDGRPLIYGISRVR